MDTQLHKQHFIQTKKPRLDQLGRIAMRASSSADWHHQTPLWIYHSAQTSWPATRWGCDICSFMAQNQHQIMLSDYQILYTCYIQNIPNIYCCAVCMMSLSEVKILPSLQSSGKERSSSLPRYNSMQHTLGYHPHRSVMHVGKCYCHLHNKNHLHMKSNSWYVQLSRSKRSSYCVDAWMLRGQHFLYWSGARQEIVKFHQELNT